MSPDSIRSLKHELLIRALPFALGVLSVVALTEYELSVAFDRAPKLIDKAAADLLTTYDTNKTAYEDRLIESIRRVSEPSYKAMDKRLEYLDRIIPDRLQRKAVGDLSEEAGEPVSGACKLPGERGGDR